MVSLIASRPRTLDTLPPTMTLEELATAMQVGMTTVRTMAREGTLPVPCVRVGRQYRVSRKAVEAWLAGESADDAA